VAEDAQALATFGARTFAEAFGADNTAADLDAYLSANFTEPRLAQELADPTNWFLIAEIGAPLVGYAKLHTGEAPKSVSGARPIELSRIYVSSDFHGRGVAPALMQRCMDDAREAGFETMWLGVWERNPRAHAFYRKWGFRKVGEHVFMFGSDPQTDWILESDLRSGPLGLEG
jgi:ribosomal protein S18 acetylase RimI-like enzyme